MPHPNVIERGTLHIGRRHQHAVPVAFLNRQLVTERVHHIVPSLGRESTKLNGCLIAADSIDPNRHLRCRNRLEPIKVWLSFEVIIRIFLTHYVLAWNVLDKDKRSSAVHVLLVPVIAVGVQVFLAVNKVERRCHCRNERTRRELQIEYNRAGIRRFDRIDHLEKGLTRTRYAFGRENDLVISGLDVRRRQGRAIMKRDTTSDLECVLRTAICTCRHIAFAQVAFKVGRV